MSDANFTIPDDPNAIPQGSAGQGAPANSVWDPVQKRWVGGQTGGQPGGGAGNAMPGDTPRPPGSSWDMESKQFVPAPTTLGSVAYNMPGRVEDGTSFGGYNGTAVRNPDGTVSLDASMSGARAETDRYQGLGAAAANRSAYQTDYSQANDDATYAAGARQGQGNAINLARTVAQGGDDGARTLAWNMLQQGRSAQQAAAASTRGGSLAQAAAMRQQQSGDAAYMQQGATQMQALRADQMAMARSQYASEAAAMRGQDAQAQGLHQGQAIGQMGNELGQRKLNDGTQQGYEGLGHDVQAQNVNAGMKSKAIDSGIYATNSNNDQLNKDREMRMVGTGVSIVGAGLAHSDARTKVGVRSLASAAMARKGSY